MPTRHTENHSIGKRLKEARLAAGLSQGRLGVRAGIDPSVASQRVNQYEREVYQPAFEIVQRLADALKKPVPYFYVVDDSLAELICLYGEMTATERAKALAAMRRVARG